MSCKFSIVTSPRTFRFYARQLTESIEVALPSHSLCFPGAVRNGDSPQKSPGLSEWKEFLKVVKNLDR